MGMQDEVMRNDEFTHNLERVRATGSALDKECNEITHGLGERVSFQLVGPAMSQHSTRRATRSLTG
jgi:hypothetical protein